MKPLKMLLPVMLLVPLTGCFSEHHHGSNVKIMTKSHSVTHVKATPVVHVQGESPKGKAKGWK